MIFPTTGMLVPPYPHNFVAVFLVCTPFVSICLEIRNGTTFTSAPVSSLTFTLFLIFTVTNASVAFFSLLVLTSSSTKSSDSSTANKGWSTVNYRQSSAFGCPYLSCNDHCDRWLQIFFFINFIFIS